MGTTLSPTRSLRVVCALNMLFIKGSFEGPKSNDDCPHKITTGNVNKTLSTYGKNFIVMLQQLHEYCIFSIQHLPEKIINICLRDFWVILVREKYHNRTSALQNGNVQCSKFTITQKMAEVSCKRIRVAITTFVSNKWWVG